MANKNYKITETFCKKAPTPSKGHVLYYDSSLPGLALRVTANGAKSWVLSYRIHGRPRRYTIDKYPTLSPLLARERAKALQVGIGQNIDPLDERQKNRNVHTVDEWCKYYLKHHSLPNLRPRSHQENVRHCRYITEKFGKNKKFRDITKADIRRWHQSYAADGKINQPRTGNKILALLSHMYSFAISEQLAGVEVNLCAGIKRHPEVQRDRFLDGDELKRFIEAFNELVEETKGAIKDAPHKRSRNKHIYDLTEWRLIEFCLLTGCRIGEPRQASWDEIDLQRGVWSKPSQHTKQKKVHRVPLSAAAIRMLKTWEKEPKRSKSNLIFPSSKPDKGVDHPKKRLTILLTRAGIEDFRIHDLRHTFASHGVMRSGNLTVIGGLLGHTQASTTFRYAHLVDDALRTAADDVGSFITAVGNDQKAEVVDIESRKTK